MQKNVIPTIISDLRDRIQRLEGGAVRAKAVLPFGMAAVDHHLPGVGLAFGSLHEISGGGGNGAVDGAAAALFCAGIAARTRGKVLWCLTRQDLFAPTLAQAGLAPGRVLYVECRDEKGVLECFEEGLRHKDRRRRRSGASVYDRFTASAIGRRRLGRDRSRNPAVAKADGSF